MNRYVKIFIFILLGIIIFIVLKFLIPKPLQPFSQNMSDSEKLSGSTENFEGKKFKDMPSEHDIQNISENDYEILPSYIFSDKGLKMKFIIKNTSSKPFYIFYPSSQRSNFELLDKNKNVIYSSGRDMVFTQAIEYEAINANSFLEYEVNLDLENNMNIINNAKYMVADVVGKFGDKRVPPIELMINK